MIYQLWGDLNVRKNEYICLRFLFIRYVHYKKTDL